MLIHKLTNNLGLANILKLSEKDRVMSFHLWLRVVDLKQ